MVLHLNIHSYYANLCIQDILPSNRHDPLCHFGRFEIFTNKTLLYDERRCIRAN